MTLTPWTHTGSGQIPETCQTPRTDGGAPGEPITHIQRKTAMNHCLTGLILVALTAAGCTGTDHPTDPGTPMLRPDPDRLSLRLTVDPEETDPRIDVALDPHIVRIPATGGNGRLFVFLPSSRVPPSTGDVFQAEAARLGYHVIGLSYPNNPGLVSFCPSAPDPDACYEATRLEVITGEDLSPFVTVSVANSIENRLTRLLQHLAITRPGDGWDRFLSGGEPKWDHIAIGGHSQGAGHAVMIAKLRRVDRVVMLSGVTDAIGGVPVSWIGPGATPPSRFYGLVHLQDNQFRPGVLANWAALGMADFGGPRVPETDSPPYGGTRMLTTNITPSTGVFAAPAPHGSTGVDLFTPFAPDGSPVLREAWRYMLGYCPPPGQWETASGNLVPCQTDR